MRLRVPREPDVLFGFRGGLPADIEDKSQKVLNLTVSNLEVDGKLGPPILAAADSFAEKELGIIRGRLLRGDSGSFSATVFWPASVFTYSEEETPNA
jgi:hypothetical protein